MKKGHLKENTWLRIILASFNRCINDISRFIHDPNKDSIIDFFTNIGYTAITLWSSPYRTVLFLFAVATERRFHQSGTKKINELNMQLHFQNFQLTEGKQLVEQAYRDQQKDYKILLGEHISLMELCDRMISDGKIPNKKVYKYELAKISHESKKVKEEISMTDEIERYKQDKEARMKENDSRFEKGMKILSSQP